jgi:hypothetical protein
LQAELKVVGPEVARARRVEEIVEFGKRPAEAVELVRAIEMLRGVAGQ